MEAVLQWAKEVTQLEAGEEEGYHEERELGLQGIALIAQASRVAVVHPAPSVLAAVVVVEEANQLGPAEGSRR